jgi:hypothetical protein
MFYLTAGDDRIPHIVLFRIDLERGTGLTPKQPLHQPES